MNRRGFTLVELLVAVAILGIITGMSIPLIRNIREKNEQKKYNTYGDSLISASKLYRDSYEDDLFGHKNSGCALVSYSQLKEKNLIKDFPDNRISCNSSDTLVRIVKLNQKYGYSYQLYCGGKSASGEAIHPTFQSSSFSRTVDQVIKKSIEDVDEDDDGFTDIYCNLVSGITITGIPNKDISKKEKHTVDVKISSTTGLNMGSGVEYAWVKADNKAGDTSVDYHSITSWTKWIFSLPSVTKQKQQLLSIPSMPIEVVKNLATPSSAPNYYLLVIKADNMMDLAGEGWKEAGNNTKYKTLGVYNVAKKYTITYDDNGGNGCAGTTKSMFHEKDGEEKWGELCIPTRDGYDFDGWKTSDGIVIDKDSPVDSNLSLIAQWKANQIVVTFDCNGGTGGATNTFKLGVENQKFDTTVNTCKRSGYELLGWANSSTSTSIDYSFTSSVSDTWIQNNAPTKTLYGLWKMDKPTTPVITNTYKDKWTNNDYNISISTQTAVSIIGKWYYKTSSSGTYLEFSGKNGLKTFNASMKTNANTVRNNTLYVIVCNKNASGANDTTNCSGVATTIVKIDKKAPTYTNICYKNYSGTHDAKTNYSWLYIYPIDEGSGVGEVIYYWKDDTNGPYCFYHNNISSLYGTRTSGKAKNYSSCLFYKVNTAPITWFSPGSYNDNHMYFKSSACDKVGNCNTSYWNNYVTINLGSCRVGNWNPNDGWD